MPKLKLKYLFCQITEDDAGADEAYLLVNGLKVWDQTINDNESRQINQVINFANSAEIKLYDRDTGVFDKDDHLGTVIVDKAVAGKGEQKGMFTLDGAKYTLFYEVV